MRRGNYCEARRDGKLVAVASDFRRAAVVKLDGEIVYLRAEGQGPLAMGSRFIALSGKFDLWITRKDRSAPAIGDKPADVTIMVNDARGGSMAFAADWGCVF